MRHRITRHVKGPVIAAVSGAAVVAGLAVAGGTGALSFAANSSAAALPAGSLHGCVSGTTRVLEDVYSNPNTGLTCPKGTFQVVWNEKGATGAQGPASAGRAPGPGWPRQAAGSVRQRFDLGATERHELGGDLGLGDRRVYPVADRDRRPRRGVREVRRHAAVLVRRPADHRQRQLPDRLGRSQPERVLVGDDLGRAGRHHAGHRLRSSSTRPATS